MKKDLLYGIVACSKTRVRCIFCGVHIPKANKCIEQHTNGSKHNDNIALMIENGMLLKNEELFCKPCNEVVDAELSVAGHIEEESHMNWQVAIEDLTQGEYIKLEPYLSSQKEDAFCEVCNEDVNCSLQALETHVNSLPHRTNVMEWLRPGNAIFPAETDDEVYCKICDVYIVNTIQSILEHIDNDDEHMQWLEEYEDLILHHDISLSPYLRNEDEINVYCKRCQSEVLCDFQTIEEHVHSESHLNNYCVVASP